MLHKNIFILAILLFCSSAHCAENNFFYIKGGYFGAFGNAMGDFSGNEEAGNVTEKIMSFNPDEELVEGYSPKYTPGLAGSGAIGYRLDAFRLPFFFPSRIEFEGLYSQLNLDDEEYGDKEKAGYIELVRSDTVATGTNCDSKWKTAASSSCELWSSGSMGYNPIKTNFVDAKAAFKIKNGGFNNLAGLVNIYYDFNIKQFTPYVGGGLGLTKVKFLEKSHYTPAYQLKLGAQYTFTEKAQIFAGLRYFGIFNDEFSGILPITKIPAGDVGALNNVIINGIDQQAHNYNYTARIGSTTATVTHRFGVYGLEIGMVYHF